MPSVRHLDLDSEKDRKICAKLRDIEVESEAYVEADDTAYRVWQLEDLALPPSMRGCYGAIAEWPNGKADSLTVSLFRSREMFDAVFANIIACSDKLE